MEKTSPTCHQPEEKEEKSWLLTENCRRNETNSASQFISTAPLDWRTEMMVLATRADENQLLLKPKDRNPRRHRDKRRKRPSRMYHNSTIFPKSLPWLSKDVSRGGLEKFLPGKPAGSLRARRGEEKKKTPYLGRRKGKT